MQKHGDRSVPHEVPERVSRPVELAWNATVRSKKRGQGGTVRPGYVGPWLKIHVT